jgi:hypothetical protein
VLVVASLALAFLLIFNSLSGITQPKLSTWRVRISKWFCLDRANRNFDHVEGKRLTADLLPA